jgi:hypothetical protein
MKLGCNFEELVSLYQGGPEAYVHYMVKYIGPHTYLIYLWHIWFHL